MRVCLILATALAVGSHAVRAQNVAVQQGNVIDVVTSANPGTPISQVTVQLPAGETLVTITGRPFNGRILEGLSSSGAVYLINPVTGAAVQRISAVTGGPVNYGAPGADRVTLAVNPVTGGTYINSLGNAPRLSQPTVPITPFPPRFYVPGDPGAATPPFTVTFPPVGRPAIGATAFVNNGQGATTTTLYGIDVARNTLVTIGGVPYSNAGIINARTNELGTPVQTVGATGVVTVPTAASLAISRSGQALAILTPVATGSSGLYSVDLTAGGATTIGGLPGGGIYTGLAFVLPTLQSYGFTQNTANVGGILDTLTLSASPRTQALIASVDAQTSAAGQNAQLLALSPAAYQGLTELTLQSLHFQDVTVRRYLRDVRQGGTEAGEQTVTYGTDRHYAMWFTGSGRTGFIKAGQDRYRESYGDFAFTGGVDYRFARGTLLGLYGGYDEGQTRLTPISPNSDAKTWFAGGYGSGTVGPVYIDAHGAYGRTDFNVRREVVDGFNGGFQYSGADGREPRSEQYQGAATGGISQDFRGAEVEPYVGAKYAHIVLRGFSEGTAAGALSLDRLTTVSIESIAGLRLGVKVPLTATAVLRPTVRGEYRHEFRDADGARDLNGSFADGTGGFIPVTFRTTPLPRDYAAVGAGFTISGNSPFSIVVDYNGEYGGQRRINGITGGFHLAF